MEIKIVVKVIANSLQSYKISKTSLPSNSISLPGCNKFTIFIILLPILNSTRN